MLLGISLYTCTIGILIGHISESSLILCFAFVHFIFMQLFCLINIGKPTKIGSNIVHGFFLQQFFIKSILDLKGHFKLDDENYYSDHYSGNKQYFHDICTYIFLFLNNFVGKCVFKSEDADEGWCGATYTCLFQ